jgi:polyisoprenoid-binding protein YceI
MEPPMLSIRGSLLAGLAVLWLIGDGAIARTWQVEDGSRIGFTALQQGSPVAGGFDRFTAAIDFDPNDLGHSRIEVEIDTASITTGHKDRDTALRSAAFFDVGQWPTARFTSAKLTRRSGHAYEAHGKLTIRDVTKDVVLPFELTIGDAPDASGKLLAEAKGELTISRLDYGVGQGDWASTKTVGEDVVIRIEIKAERPR